MILKEEKNEFSLSPSIKKECYVIDVSYKYVGSGYSKIYKFMTLTKYKKNGVVNIRLHELENTQVKLNDMNQMINDCNNLFDTLESVNIDL